MSHSYVHALAVACFGWAIVQRITSMEWAWELVNWWQGEFQCACISSFLKLLCCPWSYLLVSVCGNPNFVCLRIVITGHNSTKQRDTRKVVSNESWGFVAESACSAAQMISLSSYGGHWHLDVQLRPRPFGAFKFQENHRKSTFAAHRCKMPC